MPNQWSYKQALVNNAPDLEYYKDLCGYDKFTHSSSINQCEAALETCYNSYIQRCFNTDEYICSKLYNSDGFHILHGTSFITEYKKGSFGRIRLKQTFGQILYYYAEAKSNWSEFDKIKFLLLMNELECYLFNTPSKEDLDKLIDIKGSIKYTASMSHKSETYSLFTNSIFDKYLVKNFQDENYVFTALKYMCEKLDNNGINN